MKKQTKKYLIIILVIVAVLAAAILALVLTDSSESEIVSSSSSSKISLSNYSETDVKSIEVIQRDDDLSFKILTTVSDSGSVSYSLEGISKDIPLATSNLSVIARAGYLLSATKDLGTTDNLAEYGLDKPQIVIKTTLNDGSSFNYSIGNESPSGGYYIMPEGTNQLYLADITSAVFKTKLELIDTTVLTVGSGTSTSDTSTNTYTYLNFSGTNFEEEITIDSNAENALSKYQFIAPERLEGASCNTTVLGELTTSLDSISAEAVAAVDPTADDLEAYGLKEPSAVLKFRANDGEESTAAEEHTLRVGTKTDDGLYPMTVDSVPVIYLVDSSVISNWYDIEPFDLRTALILIPNIVDVNSVTVQTSDNTHVFTLSRTLNEETSTEDEPEYDYTVVGSDNQELTYSTFQTYYEGIISLQLLEESFEEVSGTPYMTITYRYYEGNPDQIAFYLCKDNDRQAIVALNGSVCGTIKMTSLDSILSNTEEMEADRNIAAYY